MDTVTRRALESEVAAKVLDADDLRLFEAIRRGKTMSGYALLHRKYEGENGVREAYERAQANVRAAINGAVENRNAVASAIVERPLDEHLLPDEDDSAGVPIRSVPAGTIGGATGALPAPPAGPPKPGRQPSSSERLPAVRDSPAPATRLSNVEISRRREATLRAALADGREVTFVDAAEILDCPPGKAVEKMVRRICVAAGERRGGRQPLKTWRLTDARGPAPAKLTPPPPSVAVARRAAPPEPAPPVAAPPPFAGVEANGAQPDPHDPAAPTLVGLQLRYLDTLITGLEGWLEGGDALPEALCDRIERVGGLADGRAEQAQIAAGAGEPG